MQGDFTRNTHNPDKNFLRVLMQQGRVQLDADWNEQVSILLDYMQTLATDLIGPYGGPENNCGFEIFRPTDEILGKLVTAKKITEAEQGDFKNRIAIPSGDEKIIFLIGAGHYYVQGKLCKNQKYELYSKQNYHQFNPDKNLTAGQHLVYLDVWERHITHIEDENELIPGIREVALGKADTTTRSELIWQVKIIFIADSFGDTDGKITAEQLKNNPELPKSILEISLRAKSKAGLLKARAKIPTGDNANTPCIISPNSRYRGAENQLYRVEIHTPGTAATATFKWSRENASVIFPVQKVNGSTITLSHVGWDDRTSLKKDDWVELVDDQYALQGSAKSLSQVASIDSMEMSITLKNAFSHSINEQSHPILRRWDQKQNSEIKLENDGTIIVKTKADEWIELEDGVEISFDQSDSLFYTTNDYWLIPARTATGDVEWPQKTAGGNSPMAVPPHGVEHHYAPLWIISVDGDGNVTDPKELDCRRKFRDLAQ
jgi:Family of unknown function (DUF6519)